MIAEIEEIQNWLNRHGGFQNCQNSALGSLEAGKPYQVIRDIIYDDTEDFINQACDEMFHGSPSCYLKIFINCSFTHIESAIHMSCCVFYGCTFNDSCFRDLVLSSDFIFFKCTFDYLSLTNSSTHDMIFIQCDLKGLVPGFDEARYRDNQCFDCSFGPHRVKNGFPFAPLATRNGVDVIVYTADSAPIVRSKWFWYWLGEPGIIHSNFHDWVFPCDPATLPTCDDISFTRSMGHIPFGDLLEQTSKRQ